MRAFLTACTLLLAQMSVFAQAPAPAVRATPQEAAALAAQIRGLVLQFLPSPLYEDHSKWGHQRKGPRGRMKNDGRWHKVRITAASPAQSLSLTVGDLVKEKSRKTFTVRMSLPALVELERQTWRVGVRLYSGETRARLTAHLAIRCELVTRVEASKAWLPDMIIRLRVLASDFRYDGVVVEHTAGVGGDAARVLGDFMLGVVKQAKPSLERKLIDKANAAVLKAGEAKEVRISLSDWLNGKAAGK